MKMMTCLAWHKDWKIAPSQVNKNPTWPLTVSFIGHVCYFQCHSTIRADNCTWGFSQLPSVCNTSLNVSTHFIYLLISLLRSMCFVSVQMHDTFSSKIQIQSRLHPDSLSSLVPDWQNQQEYSENTDWSKRWQEYPSSDKQAFSFRRVSAECRWVRQQMKKRSVLHLHPSLPLLFGVLPPEASDGSGDAEL